MAFNLRTSFATRWRTSATIPRRSVRYPRHANSWLEESLCETASLFTLRAMSRSWGIAPPYPAWKNYARWLNHYAEQRLAQPGHHLPPGTPFLAWFKQNEPALRANPAVRDRNTVIAIQLLPLFEADPRGWEALVFLNRGSRRRRCVARRASGGVAIPVPPGPPSLPRQACGSFRSQALAAAPKALASRTFVGRLHEWSSTRLAATVL